MYNTLLQRIYQARNRANHFFDSLVDIGRSKYTLNHDVNKYPAACLYGAWSRLCGKVLISSNLEHSELESIANEIISYKHQDGTFFPDVLLHQKPSKSYEYLILHTYNYASGALHLFNNGVDLSSEYMDWFLEYENLRRWLQGRCFSRPWEESNNIVNVASYLAWKSDMGDVDAIRNLEELYQWHVNYQDPITAGFGNLKRGYNHTLQSMAGAVHNFHIHHFLERRMNLEDIIAKSVIPYLFEGPLTACLSIDFVELGVYSLPYIDNFLRNDLIAALLYHTQSLLDYQRIDGGWLEGEDEGAATSAAGMKEESASSCSYATWFRLCSLGMVAIALLGDEPSAWNFRKTLGMGYVNPTLLQQYEIPQIDINKIRNNYLKSTTFGRFQKKVIKTISRYI